MSETSGLNQKTNTIKNRIRTFFIQTRLAIRSVLLGRKQKIFVLSFQRSGTKSTGKFFREHGYIVSSWGTAKKLDWPLLWLRGSFEAIFSSLDFKAAQVYEDSPWFYPGFYKVLFEKFPNAKFVFLERNSDKWFDSMMSHSNQRTLGNTHIHAMIYERMDELNANPEIGFYENSILNGLPLTEEYREKYKYIYKRAISDVKAFFSEHDPKGNQFFFGNIEDDNVWLQLGDFVGVKVNEGKVFHAHKTNKRKNATP